MPTPSGTNDIDWHAWVGRTEQRIDTLTSTAAAALAATLDRDEPEPQPGDETPPLAHWLLFNSRARQSELGADGHPQHGGFLPPVPLPRRMWAGGRLEFHQPLHIGEVLTRTSRIVAIDSKQGRSGALVFINLRHEINGAHGLAVVEEQDLVFRDAPTNTSPAAPVQAVPEAQFERTLVPDPVLLFRYSALTFNAHRIHYDLPYATGVEGYPGLIVHGPLLATLLLDLLRREHPRARIRRFSFRALRPLFADQPCTLCGRYEDTRQSVVLWTRAAGSVTLEARAEILTGL